MSHCDSAERTLRTLNHEHKAMQAALRIVLQSTDPVARAVAVQTLALVERRQ